MTEHRPPLSARWEYHLLSAAGTLLLAALQSRSRHTDTSNDRVTDPHVRAWLDSSKAAREQTPWQAQLNLERSVLRGLTSAWLAWRAYRFERAARPPRP